MVSKNRTDAITPDAFQATGKPKRRSLVFAILGMAILILALAGCSLFRQEERVYDAFYDAEEIVTREFGTDSYELLHNSDLPFYTGDNTDHVVVYVNGEDGSKSFDRLWIIVSPETESEAISVLKDFEAYLDLGNGLLDQGRRGLTRNNDGSRDSWQGDFSRPQCILAARHAEPGNVGGLDCGREQRDALVRAPPQDDGACHECNMVPLREGWRGVVRTREAGMEEEAQGVRRVL